MKFILESAYLTFFLIEISFLRLFVNRGLLYCRSNSKGFVFYFQRLDKVFNLWLLPLVEGKCHLLKTANNFSKTSCRKHTPTRLQINIRKCLLRALIDIRKPLVCVLLTFWIFWLKIKIRPWLLLRKAWYCKKSPKPGPRFNSIEISSRSLSSS